MVSDTTPPSRLSLSSLALIQRAVPPFLTCTLAATLEELLVKASAAVDIPSVNNGSNRQLFLGMSTTPSKPNTFLIRQSSAMASPALSADSNKIPCLQTEDYDIKAIRGGKIVVLHESGPFHVEGKRY